MPPIGLSDITAKNKGVTRDSESRLMFVHSMRGYRLRTLRAAA